MIENATGLILRTRPLTDTSLIVHWLTPELGRVAMVAKGARRPKSAFAGKLDIFYECAFSFQRSKRSDLHLLREVNLRQTNANLRGDLDKLRQISYCAALIEQATETDSPIPEIHSLMLGFLSYLTGHAPKAQLLLAFELKLLSQLGLQPDFEQEKFAPDLRQIMRAMSEGKWEVLSRLRLSAGQLKGLERFLRGFIEYHLGKVLKGREAALQASN